MRRALFVLALCASPALGAPVVICDAATARVVGFDRSANTPEYIGNAAALINPPSLVLMASVPREHVLCVGSDGAWLDVREMLQAEKDALAAEQAAAAIVARADGAKATYDADVMVRALAAVLLDFENRMILAMLDALNNHMTVSANAGHNRPAITEAQARNAILARSGQLFTEAELRNALRNKADELSGAP